MSKNVFKDLDFGHHEAINLKMRSELMIVLREYIDDHSLTQSQAARQLGVDQPQVSRLLQGKIEYSTVDKLLKFLSRIGVKVTWKIAA